MDGQSGQAPFSPSVPLVDPSPQAPPSSAKDRSTEAPSLPCSFIVVDGVLGGGGG